MRINLDVLVVLDALEKHGSFSLAAESLFKTPAALSYMIQKTEHDLNITLLDRSGYKAKFTDTGKMMLEKGRLLLNAARWLEKQAVQVHSGWEKELLITLDCSFPFDALLPLIQKFYSLNQQTQLRFSYHTLAGSWEALTHNNADIIIGAINEPPTSAAWSYKMVGTLNNIFVVAPNHPLAKETNALTNDQLSLHRAVSISDSARLCKPFTRNQLDEQPQIIVDNFQRKIALLCAGIGCGFLPRNIAEPWLVSGKLIEKTVLSFRPSDIAYMAWHNHSVGLAQRWWRETLLGSDIFSHIYGH